MQLYIPTRARANRQHTYDNLPRGLQDQAIRVIDHDERHDMGLYPGEVLIVPPKVSGIARIRQFIVDYALRHGQQYVCMLDDDLRFATRRNDDPTKFQPASSGDVHRAFEYLAKAVKEYGHAALLPREGANRITTYAVEATRALRVLAYDCELLKRLGVKFRLPVMEDFDVTLQLLRKGYPNIVLCQWVHDQGSSGAPGGCSTYRTLQVQAQGAKELARLHPAYVRLVTKTTKTAWGGATRTDVQVQWKQALKEGNRAHKGTV